MKLAIASDMHGDINNFVSFIGMLPDDIDAIVLAGDIPGNTTPQQDITTICKTAVLKGKPVYVMPGNYENAKQYTAGLRAAKHKLLIDVRNKKTMTIQGCTVAFVPGGDLLAHDASYLVVASKIDLRKHPKKLHKHAVVIDEYAEAFTQAKIVISHIPPRMRGSARIDYATYAVATEGFAVSLEDEGAGQELSFATDELILNQFGFAEELHALGAPVAIHEEHVGHKALAQMLRTHNVPFLLCGHIHEQGGVACTKSGKSVREGVWTDQLFYNVGAVMDGKAAIVEYQDGKMKYYRLVL